MNNKPRFSLSTTPTQKNSRPVAQLGVSDLDRQARAETYLSMMNWQGNISPTKSVKEIQLRAYMRSAIEVELHDLGYDLIELAT